MPIGYTTYYGGSFEDLVAQASVMAAQEESTPEGTLALLELTLPEPATPETLVDLNGRLVSAGVPPWPGYSGVVSANANKLYIAWVKGFTWMPIIIGILFLVIPGIIGGIIWFLIPESIKNMIMMMGLMLIMIPMMRMVTKER